MPLASDPDATARYWLKSDASKPEESRPTFYFRFITRRQRTQIVDLLTRANATASDAECFSLLGQAILLGLKGWKNILDESGQTIEFSKENWDAPLTSREIWEMAIDYPAAVSLAEADKKKSDSQSPADGVPSATDAEAANVPTNPPPPNQSS